MSTPLRTWLSSLLDQHHHSLLVSKQICERYSSSDPVYREAHAILQELATTRRLKQEQAEAAELERTRLQHRRKVDHFFHLLATDPGIRALVYLESNFDKYHQELLTQQAADNDPEQCTYADEELQPIRDAIQDAFFNSDETPKGAHEWLITHCDQNGKGVIAYMFPGLWEDEIAACLDIAEDCNLEEDYEEMNADYEAHREA